MNTDISLLGEIVGSHSKSESLGFDAQESPPVLTQFSLATILAVHKCYKSSSFDAKSDKGGRMRNDNQLTSEAIERHNPKQEVLR
ncbi:MAG: hypothetical protein Fur0044_15490 [Anaerolineae bacterium]|nr:hypothetical protein [Anaerolineae bacterium]